MWRRRLSSFLRPPFQSSSSKSVANLPAASQIVLQQGQTRHFVRFTKFAEALTGNDGQTRSLSSINTRFAYQLIENCRMVGATHSFIRSLTSRAASDGPGHRQTEKGQKAVSTVEDPFDSPTYHIPEKPVTFTEGASYGIVILAGFGIFAAAAYAVFKELIFEPKEYKIFNKALERIQNDGQVRVRVGTPIKGYGQESRNRSARQRIPHRTWTDEDGMEHIEVNFHIRGPHGGGKVYCEMFKDKTDGQWKFMYLIVDILRPSPKQLILESFLPA